MNLPANGASNLSDSDNEDLYAKVFPPIKKKRREYDTQDRKVMMQYLLANNRMDYLKSRTMWVEMEQKKILPGRSWQSLKEHFVKKLLPFHLHELSLNDSDLEFIFNKVPSAKVSYDAIVNKKNNILLNRRLEHEEFFKKISPNQPFSFGVKNIINETDHSETPENTSDKPNAIEEFFTSENEEMDTNNDLIIEESPVNDGESSPSDKESPLLNDEESPLLNILTPVNYISDSSNDSFCTALFNSPSTSPQREPSQNYLIKNKYQKYPPKSSNLPSKSCIAIKSEEDISILDPPSQQYEDANRNLSDCSQESSSSDPSILKKAVVLLERLPANNFASCSPATRITSSKTTQTKKSDSHQTNCSENNRSRRIPFSLEEDLCILQYIINNDRQQHIGGNVLWQDMEEVKMELLKNRSWQSLKERYRKRILPRISEYPLDEQEIRKLGGTVARNRTHHQVPPTRQPPPTSPEDVTHEKPVPEQPLEPPPVSSSEEEFAPRRYWKAPLLVKPKKKINNK